MKFWTSSRAAVRSVTLLIVAVSASACLGPTYGTDKTATAQLIDDLSDMTSIKPQKGQDIAYTPRPAIVKPPNSSTLPAPQQSVAESNAAWVESPEQTRTRLIAEADANQDSVNYRSPLARVSDRGSAAPLGVGESLTEADAGPTVLGLLRGDAGRARPQAVRNPKGPQLPAMSPRNEESGLTPTQVLQQKDQDTRFQQNLKIQKGAYSDRRRYLSDPPLTYRAPAETAPVGDVGEPERVKEKRRIANATKEKKSGSWFKIPVPW